MEISKRALWGDWYLTNVRRRFEEHSGFVLISLTFETIDVAQVDVCYILDVWQVIRQSELAAVSEIDSASIGADIADHADNTACEGACVQPSKERSRNRGRVNYVPRTS